MMILNPVKGAVLKKSATNTPDRHLIDKPIEIRWFQKSDNGHLLVCVDQLFKGQHNWFIFSEHCTIVENGVQVHPIEIVSGKSVRLKVPFWHQLDNRYESMRTCNTSACAMAAKFLGAKINSDDEYYQIVRKYGDSTDHDAQTKALKEIGIKSTWHTNLDFEDLDKSLLAGKPIVIGILHRGTLVAPTGGHMVAVIGKDAASSQYITNDPFGCLPYTSDVKEGEGAIYSRKMLTHRWTAELSRGIPKSGWGRLFA